MPFFVCSGLLLCMCLECSGTALRQALPHRQLAFEMAPRGPARTRKQSTLGCMCPLSRCWAAAPTAPDPAIRGRAFLLAASMNCKGQRDSDPLHGYLAHFQVEAPVKVASSADKGGLGLFASRDLDAGETLAAVPRRAVIMVSQGDACPWPRDNWKVGVERIHAAQVWQALPLFLKLAWKLVDSCDSSGKAGDDGAALQQYFDLLPRKYACALSWAMEDLCELQDPHMVSKVLSEQARADGHYLEICRMLKAPPAKETWTWALQTVLSRAFAFHTSEDGLSFTSVHEANAAALLPFIDSANHDPDVADTNIRFDGDREVFLLSTASPARQGDEVMISYGRKNNDQLLLNHGFVLGGNPEDEYMIPDARHLLNLSAGTCDGQESACCFTRDLAHPLLLEFAATLFAERGDQPAFPDLASVSEGTGSRSGSALGGASPLDSPEILAKLVKVCDAARESMATSIEDDERLLESLARERGGRLRLRLAVEFRYQKKLLLIDVGEALRRQERCLRDRAALFSSLFPSS